jgi:hypothetical protein
MPTKIKSRAVAISRVYVIGDSKSAVEPLFKQLKHIKALDVRMYKVNADDVREIERACPYIDNFIRYEIKPDTTPFAVSIVAAGANQDKLVEFVDSKIARFGGDAIPYWTQLEQVTPALRAKLRRINVGFAD